MSGRRGFRRGRDRAVTGGVDVVPLEVLLPVQAPIEAPVEPGLPDGPRCRVEVILRSGRAAAVVFKVRLETVEVWHHHEIAGIFDREELRLWLSAPDLEIIASDVMLTWDLMVDRSGRVALSLWDVREWTLSPVEFASLKDLV